MYQACAGHQIIAVSEAGAVLASWGLQCEGEADPRNRTGWIPWHTGMSGESGQPGLGQWASDTMEPHKGGSRIAG